jgi:hypothetical protein
LDDDKQRIRKVCRQVMRNRKAKFSERLQAASLLAGIQGLYGPGRPKVSAPQTPIDGKSDELNKRSPKSPRTIEEIIGAIE